jgi:hypothetical protein
VPWKPLCLLLIAAIAATSFAAAADDPVSTNTYAPTYTADGKLVQPAGYREWVYLSSGLDMSYNPKAMASPSPMFDNTFVNPQSYRSFVRNGTWPDKTVIVLEVRGSTGKGSINQRGHYQSGGVQGMEVHVKDTARFDGGWAFFSFDDSTAPAKQIPVTEQCYSCHRAHAAVDTTFVQFYPVLLPIAQQHSTLSAAYLQDTAELGKPPAK